MPSNAFIEQVVPYFADQTMDFLPRPNVELIFAVEAGCWKNELRVKVSAAAISLDALLKRPTNPVACAVEVSKVY